MNSKSPVSVNISNSSPDDSSINNPSEFPQILERLWTDASTKRFGPVVLELPVDMSYKNIDQSNIDFKETVRESFETLGKGVQEEVANISDNIEALNEKSLSSLKEDVQSIGTRVKKLLEEDLPEYQKFFAETELKTEDRIDESEKKVEDAVTSIGENYKENISEVEQRFEERANTYKKDLVESKLKAESTSGLLAKDIVALDKRIDSICEGVTGLQDNIDNKDGIIKHVLSDQLSKIETVVKESKALANNYRKDFRNREIESDKKLEEYFIKLESFSKRVSGVENHLTENICDIQENLDTSTSTFFNELKSEVDLFQEDFSKKVKDLKVDFLVYSYLQFLLIF